MKWKSEWNFEKGKLDYGLRYKILIALLCVLLVAALIGVLFFYAFRWAL